MMQKNSDIDVKASIFVRALNEVGTERLDKVLKAMNYRIDDIYDSLCNPDERTLSKFMNDLIIVVDRLSEEDRKKHYSPDDEYLKAHPDTDIYMTND